MKVLMKHEIEISNFFVQSFCASANLLETSMGSNELVERNNLFVIHATSQLFPNENGGALNLETSMEQI